MASFDVAVGNEEITNLSMSRDPKYGSTVLNPEVIETTAKIEDVTREKAELLTRAMASEAKLVSLIERRDSLTRSISAASSPNVASQLNSIQRQIEAAEKESALYKSKIRSASTEAERLRRENSAHTIFSAPSSIASQANQINRDTLEIETMMSASVLSATQIQDVLERSQGSDEAKGNNVAFSIIAGGITEKNPVRSSLRLVPAPTDGSSSLFTDFFLTGVQETTREKFQIIQTFGTDFMFAFGRSPLIYAFNGIVFNTLNKQWKNNLRFLYDTKFRATQLVKANRRAIMTFEDVVVEGYLLNMDMAINSQNPHAVPFSFSMYIINEFRVTSLANETRSISP